MEQAEAGWQLAQVNVGRLVGARDDARVAPFLAATRPGERAGGRVAGVRVAAPGRGRECHGAAADGRSVVHREHVGVGGCGVAVRVRLSERACAGDGATAGVFRTVRGSVSGAVVGAGGASAEHRRGAVAAVAARPVWADAAGVHIQGAVSGAGWDGAAGGYGAGSLVRGAGLSGAEN